MNRIVFSLTFLFLSAALVFAQDPSWHTVPKEDLLGNRGEIAKTIQSTQDESTLLQIWQRPETDEGVLYLKMLAAKRLGLYGTKEAVPILVTRLDNDQDGFYARYALETIPGSEVDTALGEALKTIKKPDVLAGILTTLGVRGNTESAAAVQPFLTHENIDIRKAAGYAYALTAGDGGVDYFAAGTLDPLLIDSGFLFAEQHAQKGDSAKAVKVYDALATANIKEYQRMAAIYQSILARSLGGVDKLFQQFAPGLPRRQFEVGLKAGRELPAGGRGAVARVMITQFSNQTDTQRKARIVRALGDRKDEESITAALPMITKLASGEHFPAPPPPAEGEEKKPVDAVLRGAAIDALRNIGNASVVGILIEAANQTDEKSVADAARNTLAALPGEEVDKAISALLEGDNPAVRAAAIGLVAERRIFSASPVLVKALNDTDESVSGAAASALGEISDIADLPVLLEMLRQAKTEAETNKILVILKSACTRFSQDAAATDVSKALEAEGTSAALKTQLLDLLKEIAGTKSLDIVNGYAWGEDAGMRNVATRILGEWRSPQDLDRLAEVCLKLAKESEEYKTRGLRGYIRLARQFDMPEERRLNMCQEVFDLASRDEDKMLIFDVFVRVISLKSLEQTVSYFDNAALRAKAAETAVAIAEKLQGKDAKIAAAMKKVLEVSGNDAVKERAQRVLDKQ
jgi:HEAT repeat protein